MADREALQRLWGTALEDAGVDDGDVDLVLVETRDPSFPETRLELPGQPGPDWPADAPPADYDDARPRVFQTTEPRDLKSPAATLGMMRYSLEFYRCHADAIELYAFNHYIAMALEPAFVGKGPGGAVIWNAIPMMRSATAAAARLVTLTFGPQVGHLHHPTYGQLFRVEHEPLERDALARTAVVFAACWPSELEAFVQTGNVLADSDEDLLVDVDAHAVDWWNRLQSDQTFASVRKSAALFVPSQDEIRALPTPSHAWRPLEGLIDRAVGYGMSLLPHG